MYPIPEPMEHQQRMELAQMVAERLIARYGKSVKAIGDVSQIKFHLSQE